MPGKIVRVLVRPATRSRARQPVVVVEAMKMENELRASRDGTVAEIHGREGHVGRRRRAAHRHSVKLSQAPAPRIAVASLRQPLPHADRRAAGGRHRRVGDRRSRAGRARARPRAPAPKYIERPLHIGALRIRLLHRQSRSSKISRIDGLHPADRPFFTAQADRRGARLVPGVRAQARRHDHVGRDDRLADARREVGRRPQFPAFNHDDGKPPRPEALHDDAEVPARVARPVRLRGSRDAVERRSARTSTSTSATCRTTTARRCSTAARWRFRTSCRCGRT